MAVEQPYSPDLNVIERLAVDYLRKRNALEQPRVHRWPLDELRSIRRIERTAVFLAALSGAISGALIGGLEVWLAFTMPDASESWGGRLEYWAIFLGVSLLISGAEILFLYWVVLHRVARITSIAGLRLSNRDIEQVIAIGLSRAALDLPDPQEPIYGIDPYARVARWKLIAYAVLYRIKIGATSFIARVLMRRVVARAALRAYIPLVAIGIYAVWNAIIIGWIMRASRIRAAGPIAVQELGERIRVERAGMSEQARRAILEAVAEGIMRSANDHPNFLLLLARLFEDLELRPGTLNLDWSSNLATVSELQQPEQDLLLAVLTVTVMLDGRPNRAQKQFLAETHAACGRPFHPESLNVLYRDFFRGQGIGILMPPPGC